LADIRRKNGSKEKGGWFVFMHTEPAAFLAEVDNLLNGGIEK
jgi:hypothetical protein